MFPAFWLTTSKGSATAAFHPDWNDPPPRTLKKNAWLYAGSAGSEKMPKPCGHFSGILNRCNSAQRWFGKWTPTDFGRFLIFYATEPLKQIWRILNCFIIVDDQSLSHATKVQRIGLSFFFVRCHASGASSFSKILRNNYIYTLPTVMHIIIF